MRASGSDPANKVLLSIRDLRAAVLRLQAKLHTLTLADVEELEVRIGLLRSAASDQLGLRPSNTVPQGVLEAILKDDIGLMNLASGMRIGLSQLGPEDIIELVPGQKPAAFEFQFKNDVLTLVDRPIRPNQEEREIALSALQLVEEQGEYIDRELVETNLSPRLKEAFAAMQRTIVQHANIVQIGMRAHLCNRLLHSEADEMSPNMFALLIGHVESIGSTLAQFEEWRIFSENALATKMDAETVESLRIGAQSLADHLNEIASTDPSVTQALRTITSWVEVGPDGKIDRRDFLGVARTIENIWSVVTKSFFSIAKETVSEGKKMAAKAILLGLMTATTAGLIAVFGGVPGAQWIETI